MALGFLRRLGCGCAACTRACVLRVRGSLRLAPAAAGVWACSPGFRCLAPPSEFVSCGVPILVDAFLAAGPPSSRRVSGGGERPKWSRACAERREQGLSACPGGGHGGGRLARSTDVGHVTGRGSEDDRAYEARMAGHMWHTGPGARADRAHAAVGPSKACTHSMDLPGPPLRGRFLVSPHRARDGALGAHACATRLPDGVMKIQISSV